MDLDISMRSSACPYTVHFYGALFREGDVWICMEVMDTSLDKFYPKVYKNGRVMSENILGKVGSFNENDCAIFDLMFLSLCCHIRLLWPLLMHSITYTLT